MPIVVSLIIRAIIQIAITLGIDTLATKYIIPLINRGLQELIELFGVSEEDAQDIVANELLIFAERVGISVLTLRSKLPTKIAERLGFTSKGYGKRALSTKARTATTGKTTQINGATIATTESIKKLSQTIAETRGLSFAKVNEITSFILKIVGAPFIIIFTLAQVIDFGNWNSGAYQKTLQKVIAVASFGLLVPDPKVPKSSVLSDDVWNRVYATYKELGAVGINDPFKLQSLPFSRQNLIDLVDKIAALGIEEGVAMGLKQVIGATHALIILDASKASSLDATMLTALVKLPQVKVFTGIVSQGTLGAGLTFTPRPDDIIESIDELQTAVQNNLAPFLVALPAKVVYEVKIVSSVTTKDGFRQTGQAQRVLSGYATDGTPRYKTVINKFATLTIFVLTDKGTRTKISTIILGPTDAMKFQPSQNHLTMLEKNIQTSVVTSNISEINTIQTTVPITVQAPAAPPPAIPLPTPPAPAVSRPPSAISAPVVSTPAITATPIADLTTLKARLDQATNYYRTGMNPLPGTVGQGYVEMVAAQKAYDEALAKEPRPATVTTSSQDTAKQKATTLYEFYNAIGQPLPSMQTRAAFYQMLGLGQSSYYVGTAEQNTKLLAKLQGK